MRCEALWGFFDADPFARPELFFARLELLFARVEPLDDDFVLPEPFDEERPRLVARVALPRSLATDIFTSVIWFARMAGLAEGLPGCRGFSETWTNVRCAGGASSGFERTTASGGNRSYRPRLIKRAQLAVRPSCLSARSTSVSGCGSRSTLRERGTQLGRCRTC